MRKKEDKETDSRHGQVTSLECIIMSNQQQKTQYIISNLHN